MIKFEILGPVRAWQGSWEADLSPQQQLLLSALVIAEGKRVSIASSQSSSSQEGSMNDAKVTFSNRDHSQIGAQIVEANAPVTINMGTPPEPAAADRGTEPESSDDEPGD